MRSHGCSHYMLRKSASKLCFKKCRFPGPHSRRAGQCWGGNVLSQSILVWEGPELYLTGAHCEMQSLTHSECSAVSPLFSVTTLSSISLSRIAELLSTSFQVSSCLPANPHCLDNCGAQQGTIVLAVHAPSGKVRVWKLFWMPCCGPGNRHGGITHKEGSA